VLFVAFILSACKSSTLSINEIEAVPNKLQNKLDSKYTLQLLDGEDISYIVFQSKGTVTAALETQGDTLVVKLDEPNQQGNELEQHIYKLTSDNKHEKIDIHINGHSTPIDNVTPIL
jgi:chaperonin cofactor prefoldin